MAENNMVLGINLLGIIAGADNLIVVDTVMNHGAPGDFHRLEHEDIPNRIMAKNSLHQVDLIEALTPEIESRLDGLTDLVLDEVKRLGGTYSLKAS